MLRRKTLIASAIALLMAISAVTFALDDTENMVSADSAVIPYCDYKTENGVNTAIVNSQNRNLNVEHLVIPETIEFDGKTYTVVAIANEAFGSYSGTYNEHIKSVTIPSTVKTIGLRAFNRCANLTSVELSEGLEKIDKFAFSKSSIESLTIPQSVTTIEQSICEECSHLKTVEVKTTADLGNFSFKKCTSLESVIVHSANLGRSAFGECPSLTSVVIKDGAKTLGEFLFNGDENLQRIEFPDTITSLPENIFYNSSIDPDADLMFHFQNETGGELEITAANLKGKVWQRFDGYFAQVVKLTLDGNGGSLTCDAEQYVRVNTALAITDPSRPGYGFGGWEPALPASVPSTDISSKAIWTVEVPQPAIYPLIFDNTVRTPFYDEIAYTLSGELSGKDAKTYTITATLTSPQNSCWVDTKDSASRTIEWCIEPKPVTVKADVTIEKQVGEADPDFRGAVSVEGVVPGDDYVISYTASCTHPERKGTYEVVVTGVRYQGNYDVSFTNGDVFLIEAHEIHKPIAKMGLVYDGNEHWGMEPGVGYDLSGEVTGTDSTAVVGHAYEGTVTIKVGYQWIEDPENRDPIVFQWAIAQKPVTVSSVIPMNKLHGTDDPENYNASVAINGLADSSHTINYTTSRESGEATDKYTIYVTGDQSQGNYTVTFHNGVDMFTIVANTIEKPVALTGLIYNGSLQTGVPSGTGYTLTGTSQAINANAPGSSYSATATLSDGFTWAGEGPDDPVVIEWTIAQKPADVIVKHRVVKTVGEEDDPDLRASVVIEGTLNHDTLAYTASRAQGEIIGDYMIYVTGDQSQGNYTVTFHDAEKFYIEGEKIPRPVARTGLIYNGQEQFGVSELPEYTVTGENHKTNATRTTPYAATVTINVGYEWETDPASRAPFDVEWTIAPLDIRVRADNVLTKNVWAIDPDFNDSVTVHGLVDDYQVAYQAACTHDEAIGEYDITVSGAEEQGNYNVEFVPGHHMFRIDGTVIDKPVPVQVTYDSTLKTGVLSGEGYTITGNTGINATRGMPIIAEAVLEEGYEWGGSPGIRNWEIPWEIDPAVLIVMVDDQLVKVGEPAQPFTVSFEGFLGNDDISVITVNSPTFDCSYTADSPAGVYDIILGGDFWADNYDFFLEDGELNCGDIIIDKPVPVLGLTYSGVELIGVVSGYGFTVTGAEATLPGDYIAIVTPLEGHSWSDETSGPFELSWTISKTPLTITADDQEVTVGDPAEPYTVTVVGFVNGEGMGDLAGTLLIECSYTVSSPAGTYPIVPSGVSSDNYDIEFRNGLLTATKYEPRPKPVPPVIPVKVTFESTVGGHVSVDSMNVPLNSRVIVNGDMLIIGTSPNAKIVRAIADAGYVFVSWSIEGGNILKDTDVTATFKKAAVVEISVKTSPDKVSYAEGDKFDPAGMAILLRYDDGSSAVLEYEGNESKFSFSPSLDTPLKADDDKVTVTYDGRSTEVPITVSGSEGGSFPWIILLIIVAAAVVAVIIWRYFRSASAQ